MTEIIWRNEKYFWKVGSKVQCYKSLQKVFKKKKKKHKREKDKKIEMRSGK